MNTIAWIGFCQSLFAAILIFTKKERSLPDKILSGWLTLLGIEFMTCRLDYEVFGQPLLSSSFLLFNPALYLYISSLTRPDFRLRWLQLLHLLPFIFFEAYAYVINEPFSLDIYFVRDKNFLFRMAFALSTIISWSVYNPLSLVYVHKHRMHLRNERSNIEKRKPGVGIGSWNILSCMLYSRSTEYADRLFPTIQSANSTHLQLFCAVIYGFCIEFLRFAPKSLTKTIAQ